MKDPIRWIDNGIKSFTIGGILLTNVMLIEVKTHISGLELNRAVAGQQQIHQQEPIWEEQQPQTQTQDPLEQAKSVEESLDNVKEGFERLGEVLSETKEDRPHEESRPTDTLDEYTSDELPTEDLVVDETNPKDPLTGPDQSVEIGGPQVDAEIAEIKELQAKHELERTDQTAEMAERREQLAEKYADSQQQQEYLTQFDEAAKAAEQALVAQQAVEMQQPPPPPPPQL
jgi:hypothetical protein